jgi:hypothetical protein
LRITDILFNRGTSQVVVNALENRVPVIVVPAGRTTFFHGLLDEVIVNESREIPEAIELVERRGMGIYDIVFQKFLSVTHEKALENAIGRINRIAENGNAYNPIQRLQEIALFWAWMGYTTQAFKTLAEASDMAGGENPLSVKIGGLISCDAGRDDLAVLTRWAGKSYREWLIKSLWIRSLYLGNKEVTGYDKEWLADFPPRMGREYFMPYVSMLCWRLLRSGMRTECESLVNNIYEEYGFLNDIRRLKRSLGSRESGYPLPEYWRTRLRYKAGAMLNDFSWELGDLVN